MSGEFRFLEDVALADAAFEASGDSPSELFKAAAQAVIETMVNPHTVSPTWQRVIEHQAPEIATLLFDWLSDIVYLKDAHGVVFREATAVVSEDRPHGGWKLRGTLTGEPIDPARHELRADVKAVTKHLYDVRHDEGREGGRWTARVVLDV
ncbi:MAG: archease [Nitrospirae bacterium]|nr:archease [Nitrospirota bacterium]